MVVNACWEQRPELPLIVDSFLFFFLSCRLVTNKLLLGVIILMELAILGGVIYVKFFTK